MSAGADALMSSGGGGFYVSRGQMLLCQQGTDAHMSAGDGCAYVGKGLMLAINRKLMLICQ